jgi:hypothetical protein
MHAIELHQYRVKDPRTGKWYRTRYKLTDDEAAQRFPERERIDYSPEVRQVPDPDEVQSGLGYLQGAPR